MLNFKLTPNWPLFIALCGAVAATALFDYFLDGGNASWYVYPASMVTYVVAHFVGRFKNRKSLKEQHDNGTYEFKTFKGEEIATIPAKKYDQAVKQIRKGVYMNPLYYLLQAINLLKVCLLILGRFALIVPVIIFWFAAFFILGGMPLSEISEVFTPRMFNMYIVLGIMGVIFSYALTRFPGGVNRFEEEIYRRFRDEFPQFNGHWEYLKIWKPAE